MYAVNGILFNHESPIRGETFVTRKITRGVAAIHRGLQDCLYLGNLDSVRDWGHARDYVRGMWMMLQQPVPDDYILATGEVHSVREFVERAFNCVGTKIAWRGQHSEEQGCDIRTGQVLVKIDPRYFRPTEIGFLQGDPSKAKKQLGWAPAISFDNMVREMIEADLKSERLGLQGG